MIVIQWETHSTMSLKTNSLEYQTLLVYVFSVEQRKKEEIFNMSYMFYKAFCIQFFHFILFFVLKQSQLTSIPYVFYCF